MSKIGFRFMSWNLKDFGNFDYSSSMEIIAQTIIGNNVDVLMIMEVAVNRRAKQLKIASSPPLAIANQALTALLDLLQIEDPGGNWEKYNTNNSCANKTRDAYALFLRTTPYGDPPEGSVLPDTIEVKNAFSIYRYAEDMKDPGFGGGRRPAGCNLTFKCNAAAPNEEHAIIMSYHALAQTTDNNLSTVQRAIGHCIDVARAQATIQATPAVVIGGDFNVDYDKNDNASWYNSLGYSVAIQENGGSSLLSAPNFDDPPVVLVGKAFDNFFFSDHLSCNEKSVIPVVHTIKEEEETLMNAYLRFYPTHKVAGVAKASGVSDHLPILGAFIFNTAGPSQ